LLISGIVERGHHRRALSLDSVEVGQGEGRAVPRAPRKRYNVFLIARTGITSRVAEGNQYTHERRFDRYLVNIGE